MLPLRAFWPLPPRPAVLPSPEAWPRPTRVFGRLAPLGAFKFDRDMKGLLLSRGSRVSRLRGARLRLARLPPDGRGSVHPLPRDEVGDLRDHPHRLRRVGQDLRRVVLLQSEPGHHGPVLRGDSRESADELHLDGSHLSFSCHAPKCPRTSCGIVVPTSGTLKSDFFAWSPPLRIASGTSFALPRPTPT